MAEGESSSCRWASDCCACIASTSTATWRTLPASVPIPPASVGAFPTIARPTSGAVRGSADENLKYRRYVADAASVCSDAGSIGRLNCSPARPKDTIVASRTMLSGMPVDVDCQDVGEIATSECSRTQKPGSAPCAKLAGPLPGRFRVSRGLSAAYGLSCVAATLQTSTHTAPLPPTSPQI